MVQPSMRTDKVAEKLKCRRPREDLKERCRAEPAARAFTRERALVPR
jgi:hypothetical protein